MVRGLLLSLPLVVVSCGSSTAPDPTPIDGGQSLCVIEGQLLTPEGCLKKAAPFAENVIPTEECLQRTDVGCLSYVVPNTGETKVWIYSGTYYEPVLGTQPCDPATFQNALASPPCPPAACAVCEYSWFYCETPNGQLNLKTDSQTATGCQLSQPTGSPGTYTIDCKGGEVCDGGVCATATFAGSTFAWGSTSCWGTAK